MIFFPTILSGLGDRLRDARKWLGLSQTELASAGGIGRTAQVSYEANLTSPSIDYVQKIQTTGIDLPFVLFGITSTELVASIQKQTLIASVDWTMIKQAYEDVDYFCSRHAPDCPSSYRWDMVAEIYAIHQSKTNSAPPTDSRERQNVVKHIWESQ